MAGKTVMIKSVLSMIPTYQMQTLLLPKGILAEIEQVSRDFLWTNQNDEKRRHHIAWDTIKKGRDKGGLGIKDLECQNTAFTMKLCWGLIAKPEALWVRCMKAKYKCGDGKIPKVVKKPQQSTA